MLKKTKTPATKQTPKAKKPVKRKSVLRTRTNRNNLLMSKIALKGIKMQDIASELGITTVSMSNKIMRRFDFKLREVRKLRDILGLTPEEVDTIFLAK